ncbi:B12-binding domain-containing radical SAM protein [Candidatus Woesearchaeota archaeon]|nr:B12-binding domain-containing radical SAM protein [Candidatus Woesearchaeota archaeon]
MKILFIRYHNLGDINTRLPETANKVKGVVPMLGLPYLAAILEKEGHEVRVIDALVENLNRDEVKKRILEFNPKVVGVTALTSTFKGSLAAAKLAKECGAITVMGGPHLEIFPKETLSYDCIDFVVLGEGENVIVKLIDAIEKGSKQEELAKMEGIGYKGKEGIHCGYPGIVEDLDSLPYPAFHLLPMDKYESVIGLKPLVTMMFGRGCPFQCGFCFKQACDKKIRFRDPIKFVDELEYWVKKYDVKEFYIYDDTFTLNHDHVKKICKEIIRRNIKVYWEAPTRVDCVNYDLLKLMKKAGCRRLRYGVDSGDVRILEEMNKRVTLNQIKDAFRWSKKIGIEAFAYFIIGYLHDTPESMEKTIRLAKEIDPSYAMFTVATPYPKTKLFDDAVKEGIIDKDYWKDFVLGKKVERIPYLAKDADKWVAKAYRKFYFRPRFLLREAKKLKNWGEFKKRIKVATSLLFNFQTTKNG